MAKIRVDVDKAFRALALETARRVIERTPVRSGKARGAWMAGVNSIPTGEAPLDKDGAATLARIEAAIAGAKAGDTIYLVNGADHAWALEYGKSDQAPAGMVRVTLIESQVIANEVVATLR
ncbi:hypothetical protein [Bradyrhizobium sp. 27S5]|uniref:hypothetical protein n=1 Tax=Bradyrhizobium sp. 27S5 TaxID=3139728 RepID=UPI0030CEE11C